MEKGPNNKMFHKKRYHEICNQEPQKRSEVKKYHFHSEDPGPLEDTHTSLSLGHSGLRSYTHTDCCIPHRMSPQHTLKEREKEFIDSLGFS